MSFPTARTLAELRFATRLVMRRHRVLRWQPLPSPQPAQGQPEWLRRGKLARVLDHGPVASS